MKTPHTFVADVDGLSLRDVAGDGTRTELLIRTKDGTWAIQLIGRRGKVVRMTDLRARDKKRTRKHRALVTLAMEDAAPRRIAR